ncbi:MAG: gp16 family protein [Alphaproteobacteria bacterium]
MTPDKRPLISKIHIAKNQLGLDDGTYRAVLKRIAGKESSSKLTYKQLVDVLNEFKNLGFKPARRVKIADNPKVRMVYALWSELYELKALKSKNGLRTWIKKMTGVAAPEWLNERQLNTVIEALKQWIERVS